LELWYISIVVLFFGKHTSCGLGLVILSLPVIVFASGVHEGTYLSQQQTYTLIKTLKWWSHFFSKIAETSQPWKFWNCHVNGSIWNMLLSSYLFRHFKAHCPTCVSWYSLNFLTSCGFSPIEALLCWFS